MSIKGGDKEEKIFCIGFFKSEEIAKLAIRIYEKNWHTIPTVLLLDRIVCKKEDLQPGMILINPFGPKLPS